jgi:hypothetical protein
MESYYIMHIRRREQMEYEIKKITIRASGKAHRAIVYLDGPYKGSITVTCSCPGSKNGRLRNQASYLCDGWEKSNCGN